LRVAEPALDSEVNSGSDGSLKVSVPVGYSIATTILPHIT
jgi:hypothetical protein